MLDATSGETRKRLDGDTIFEAAISESGLGGYADPGIRERFDYLIGLFNDFGTIRESLYGVAADQMKSVVIKRLHVARDWAENPEILESEIVQPFFVIGNARAGTTFTQMILAMDEGHRTPRYRDVQHPSPPRGADVEADRRALEEQGEYVDFITTQSPRMMSGHPYFDQRAETEAEDEYTYSLDLDLAYPLWYLKVPNLPQCLPPRDPVRAFEFFKNMLKQYQWTCPTGRWVGKGVIHQYIADPLLEVFPDMVGFWVHRKPEELVGSLLELLEIQYAPFNDGQYNVDPDAMVEQLCQGVDHILSCPAIDDARIHHINFRDLVNDPAAVIAPIYEAHNIAFTDDYAGKIKQRMSDPAHRSDRYGKFEYSLDKFGLDGAELRRKFADYCERFDL